MNTKMDITWGLSTELVSKNGKVFQIEPLQVWENVKVLNVRNSLKGSSVSDIEYNGEFFSKVPYSIFLIHN